MIPTKDLRLATEDLKYCQTRRRDWTDVVMCVFCLATIFDVVTYIIQCCA